MSLKTGSKGIKTKWRDEFYVKAHRLALEGYSNKEIARALDIAPMNFNNWVERRPALKEALRSARVGKAGGTASFREYVYERLPDELKLLWDKINKSEELEGRSTKHLSSSAIESLFSMEGGKHARMHLFIYAFVHYNFNASAACRAVNVTWNSYQKWLDEEEGFAELVEEIHIHKKNMFESHLIEAVKSGDTAAIIFANKSINGDRGYNDKKEIAISGSIEHNVRQVDDLNLSLEVRKALLEAMRKEKEPKALGMREGMEAALAEVAETEVVDAEYEEAEVEEAPKRKKKKKHRRDEA